MLDIMQQCRFFLCYMSFNLSSAWHIRGQFCHIYYEFSMILRYVAGLEEVARLNRSNSLIIQGHGSSVCR